MNNQAVAENEDEYTEGDAEHENEYLTFYLADEEYGVDILRVKEIRGWEHVTRIPNSPDYVKGVLNLRGAIVPIIDLRIRCNLPPIEYTETTVVIIVAVKNNTNDSECIKGIVVDTISDVVNADLNDIQNTPEFDTSIEIEYIEGLATSADNMLMLIDVDKLLDMTEAVNADED